MLTRDLTDREVATLQDALAGCRDRAGADALSVLLAVDRLVVVRDLDEELAAEFAAADAGNDARCRVCEGRGEDESGDCAACGGTGSVAA